MASAAGFEPALSASKADVLPLNDAPLPRVDVPCGKCTLCCRTTFVFLRPDEYEQYEWGWALRNGDPTKPIGRVLNRKPDGACVYLGDQGCTIHDRAPRVCREFDCRTLFIRSDRNGRRLAVKNGEVSRELFEQGRVMVEKAKIVESGEQEEAKPPELGPAPAINALRDENRRLRSLLGEAIGLIEGTYEDANAANRLKICLDAIPKATA